MIYQLGKLYIQKQTVGFQKSNISIGNIGSVQKKNLQAQLHLETGYSLSPDHKDSYLAKAINP